MQIKALAPWFGGKRTLAPRIVAELGPHRAYWEPFCGSLAKDSGKRPIMNLLLLHRRFGREHV